MKSRWQGEFLHKLPLTAIKIKIMEHSFRIEKSIHQDFINFLNEQSSDVVIRPQLSLNMNDMYEYLFASGGLVSFTTMIVSYLKIRNKTRKVSIEKPDGTKIIIEASSVNELKNLIETAKSISIEEQKNESE